MYQWSLTGWLGPDDVGSIRPLTWSVPRSKTRDMYRILGADGREYGPATADQVRGWIKDGRANASTRVRLEGTAEWRSLADFPEFAEALGRKGPPPVQTVFGGSAQAEAIANEILARDYDLDIGSCIRRAWNLVFSNFWPIFGTTLLAIVLMSVAGSLPPASLALGYVLMGGLQWYLLKQIRGEQAELSDLMTGVNVAFVPLMLFSIVGQLLTGIGFFLCILPGIYLTVAWLQFTPLLILEKKIDFWPAMELSRKVVTRHWWVLFGLLLVELGLALLGLMVCCVGIFVMLPVITAATVYAYEDIFNPPPRAGLPSATPSPFSPPPAPAAGLAPVAPPAPAPAPAPATPPAPAPEPGRLAGPAAGPPA